ncbi:unnamed protein product, partial [Linum tenue]
ARPSDVREGLPRRPQRRQGGGGSPSPDLEPEAVRRRGQDGQAPGQVPVRQPDRQPVRRQPDVVERRRRCGPCATRGGGEVGGGGEVLRPPQQHVRVGPHVRCVHAGGVEEVRAAGVRLRHVCEGQGQPHHLLLRSPWKLRWREPLLSFFFPFLTKKKPLEERIVLLSIERN